MTAEEILQIIADNFLCIRRLPFEVITINNYREGDENKMGGFNGRQIYLEDGKTLNATREIITGFGGYDKDRKFIKTTKIVEKGGWYYVKSAEHTGSTIMFNRKYDTFFGPTLKDAIKLYLESNFKK